MPYDNGAHARIINKNVRIFNRYVSVWLFYLSCTSSHPFTYGRPSQYELTFKRWTPPSNLHPNLSRQAARAQTAWDTTTLPTSSCVTLWSYLFCEVHYSGNQTVDVYIISINWIICTTFSVWRWVRRKPFLWWAALKKINIYCMIHDSVAFKWHIGGHNTTILVRSLTWLLLLIFKIPFSGRFVSNISIIGI